MLFSFFIYGNPCATTENVDDFLSLKTTYLSFHQRIHQRISKSKMNNNQKIIVLVVIVAALASISIEMVGPIGRRGGTSSHINTTSRDRSKKIQMTVGLREK
jgi:hypothetical protein